MREIVGKILIAFGGVMLIASAGAKFAHVPQVVTQLGGFGFEGNRLMLIATLELLSALLFLVPSSRSIGVLLVSAFMGGAIATHLQHGQSLLLPAVCLSLVWVGAWLRHPEVLRSLGRSAHDPSRLAYTERREGTLRERQNES
jgi:DoxX-like protein